MEQVETKPDKTREERESVTVRFAGDSGDGMQLTGDRFANISAVFGNDVITYADYPAEIRAPLGTTYGVSGYQLKIGAANVYTPGDEVDILVAMNPAALQVNIKSLRPGGTIIVNKDTFIDKNFAKIGIEVSPLEDGTLEGFQVHDIPVTTMTKEALKDSGLGPKDQARCKNFYTLGLVCWLLGRPVDHTLKWVRKKFANKPELSEANVIALKEGYIAGDVRELFNAPQYIAPKHQQQQGLHRFVSGNQALALGLVAAGQKANKDIFFGSYPITPASDVLHAMSNYRHYGVTTYQAEDEIAAIGSAIGAAWAGSLAVTSTSGPGLALKGEFIGLAVITELPLVILDVQRGGPSTGMPTKTEQSDLMLALNGRNGEAPIVVMAAESPADCFMTAYEACAFAMKYMTPVVVLSDGYLANGNEAWKIPDPASLPAISCRPLPDGESYQPYLRDTETLARSWVPPGNAGYEHRIGGLEKQDVTGEVSMEPENHQYMTDMRAAKVERVAQDFPPQQLYGPAAQACKGKLLVMGWGSTCGAIRQAVAQEGEREPGIAWSQLRYIHPFPKELKSIFRGFDQILVPENNSGQLLAKLRATFPEANFEGLNKLTGQPFKIKEIRSKIRELTGGEV